MEGQLRGVEPVAKEEKEGTHDECEELGQTLWTLEDDASIEERRGELKEGEGETGCLCERGLVAELEDFLLDFGGEEGERRRGRRGHFEKVEFGWLSSLGVRKGEGERKVVQFQLTLTFTSFPFPSLAMSIPPPPPPPPTLP